MILAEIGKFLGAKVATAIIFLAVLAGGIWCYQNPETVKAFGHALKMALLWIVVAAALPWSSYLFIRPLLRFQAGQASAGAASAVSVAVIAAFWVVDVMLAFYLADWGVSGTMTWIVLLLGLVAAGANNFVICESLARYVDT